MFVFCPSPELETQFYKYDPWNLKQKKKIIMYVYFLSVYELSNVYVKVGSIEYW